MSDLRDAAEQALDALEDIFGKEKKDVGVINALRQALAQPEQKPVAWMWKDGSLTSDPDEADGTWTKLYTIPVEYKAEIERLHREIENLRQAYHRVKDENERLSLDLGIKDNPQFGKPF